jgi:hypothetical protein
MGTVTSLLWMTWLGVAQAQSAPSRQVPPTVLVDVRLLENRFEQALAVDCAPERCYPKGCAYAEHAVADRPRRRSLPGLGDDPGPGSTEPQHYLTRATCSFAFEASSDAPDVAALSRRLEAKLSVGWTVVGVQHQQLQPLAPYLREAPKPEAAEEPEPEEEAVAPPPPQWTMATAARELWSTLLPHVAWMVALVMLTIAATLLMWAWRRVGRESIEDQMLLAELARGEAEGEQAEQPGPSAPSDEEFVALQHAAWLARLGSMDPQSPDPELQALIRELLRAGELPLLAKAVLRFPSSIPAAFPSGGEVASAKLELAAYLKTVDVDALPSDADFFRQLNHHALSAVVASQHDAKIVRSLREDFGAEGLVTLIGSLSARCGGLLFALASAEEQHEMVRLLSAQQTAQMSEQLLRSNRMDPDETTYLFQVIQSARGNQPRPTAPPPDVSDRGTPFDAEGALSLLLPRLDSKERGRLFLALLHRFEGSLPAWYRCIFLADMLFALPREARVDLLLEVDVEPLAAWLTLLDPPDREPVLDAMPASLRASIGSMRLGTGARLLALANQGRAELATAFQGQLDRAGIPFEHALRPSGEET